MPGTLSDSSARTQRRCEEIIRQQCAEMGLCLNSPLSARFSARYSKGEGGESPPAALSVLRFYGVCPGDKFALEPMPPSHAGASALHAEEHWHSPSAMHICHATPSQSLQACNTPSIQRSSQSPLAREGAGTVKKRQRVKVTRATSLRVSFRVAWAGMLFSLVKGCEVKPAGAGPVSL